MREHKDRWYSWREKNKGNNQKRDILEMDNSREYKTET